VLGPATVVEAVAQGNEVALAVDAYLQNGTPISKEGWLDYTDVPLTWVMEDYAEAVRAEVPVQDPTTRRLNWRQVELGLAENVCREQCMRCLRCDIEEKG
jgi:NADH-quinone oxidoreductase subunit F